ncbi:putative zinc-finger protein [Scheffersomyces coipomensis]|uniref:putative zinc-finger protein n=1 Tax=Scheffersomyces coipomensis TaxID=1788519 RepID=UPI00315CACBD
MASGNNIEKPKPLKVFGRTHYACTRCKLSKIKCSGEKPACSNCKSINKPDACIYPTKDRKIVIMESDLNKLHDRVEYLELLLKQQDQQQQQQQQQQNQPHQRIPQPQLLHFSNQYALHSSSLSSGSSSTASTRTLPSLTASTSASATNSSFPSNTFTNDIISNNVIFEDFYSQLNSKNDSLKLDLIKLCYQRLPEKALALKFVNRVYTSYSTEFYLIDIVEVHDIIDRVYAVLASFNASQTTIPFDSHTHICQLSLCYIFIIFAFGEQLLSVSNPSTNSLESYPGIQYYLLSEHLFPLTRESVEFKFIQTALLLGFYTANLNRYNTVYNYLGVAARSAVSQGFHRQSLNKSTDPVFAEKAKRLWWSVFVIDTTWATKTVHFQYTDTDVDLPTENYLDLNDNFNSNILEVNVHLTKYVAKFVRLIYGPNIRTFSINYINTSQFNQKLLLKNIINSSNDLIKNFENTLLSQFSNINIITDDGNRNLTNLFLRYHQLIILITKPLLSLIFDPLFNFSTSSDNLSSNDVNSAISKGLLTSCGTIDLISHLYLNNRLFMLGYWDSQHLLSALIFLIIISCINNSASNEKIPQPQFIQINKATSLLKFMADRGNINARTCFDKVVQINNLLINSSPYINFQLNLSITVDDIPLNNPNDNNAYNPLVTSPLNSSRKTIEDINHSSSFNYLPPTSPQATSSTTSSQSPQHQQSLPSVPESLKGALFKLINEIQSWN